MDSNTDDRLDKPATGGRTGATVLRLVTPDGRKAVTAAPAATRQTLPPRGDDDDDDPGPAAA